MFVTLKQDYINTRTLTKVWKSRVFVLMQRKNTIYICGTHAMNLYYQSCKKLSSHNQKLSMLQSMNRHTFIYTFTNAKIAWENRDSNTVFITKDNKIGQGWIRREVKRKGGKSQGKIDKYWNSHVKGCILRSYKQVQLFIDIFNEHNSEDITYIFLTCKSQNKN